MDKSRSSRKRKVQPEGKLSFGSALKQNFKNTGSAGKKPKKKQKKIDLQRKSLIFKRFLFQK